MGQEGEMCVRLDTRQAARPWPFRWLARDERGVEVLEAALVLPILLTLLLGMFWLGRAYNIYQTITRAAREGARFALAPSCATCGNSFPSDDEVKTIINNALSVASMDSTKVSPAIIILPPQPRTGSQVLNPSDPPSNQVEGVVVSFGYPMTLYIPFTTLNATTITITTQVQMRKEL
jgi:Flp pilus assembly protein TadG